MSSEQETIRLRDVLINLPLICVSLVALYVGFKMMKGPVSSTEGVVIGFLFVFSSGLILFALRDMHSIR